MLLAACETLCMYILFKRRSSRPAKGSRSLKCTFKWITTWLSVQRKPSKTHTPSRCSAPPVCVSLISFSPWHMPEVERIHCAAGWPLSLFENFKRMVPFVSFWLKKVTHHFQCLHLISPCRLQIMELSAHIFMISGMTYWVSFFRPKRKLPNLRFRKIPEKKIPECQTQTLIVENFGFRYNFWQIRDLPWNLDWRCYLLMSLKTRYSIQIDRRRHKMLTK